MLVNIQSWGETLRLLVELAGTAAFAVSGVLEAARKKLDAVGVCVVAFLTAFGGGTLRDLLLDRRPFFWVAHVELLWGVMALCVLAMLFLREHHFEVTEKAIQWPDALGLGLFTATGVHLALDAQMPMLVAVSMVPGRVAPALFTSAVTLCLAAISAARSRVEASSVRSPWYEVSSGWLQVGST